MTSLSVNRLKHHIAVIAFVGDDVFRRESFQQWHALSDVMRLTGREQKLHRVAQSIASGANLRAESATRSAEFLIAAFFRAPAAGGTACFKLCAEGIGNLEFARDPR